MVDALAVLEKTGQVMVLMVAAHEHGHHLAFAIHHAVGDAEAEPRGVKVFDRG